MIGSTAATQTVFLQLKVADAAAADAKCMMI
jgi:hypothetical protein